MAQLKNLLVNGVSRFIGSIYGADAKFTGTVTANKGIFNGQENKGSSTKPIYWSNGAPVEITSYEGKAATAGTADKLGTNAGSSTQPIYFANGVPVAITGNITNGTTGNAATATAFSSGTTVKLTGDVTGESASSTKGWTLSTAIGAGKVTNAMLAGSIENGKLVNSKVTIAGNDVSLGGSLSASTLRSSLGLSSAMHFIGTSATVIEDGDATKTDGYGITGYTSGDEQTGDVILYNDEEFVWTGLYWELLGRDSSFIIKPLSTTDNAIARYDGTNGDLQNSLVTINDTGSITLGGTWTDTSANNPYISMGDYARLTGNTAGAFTFSPGVSSNGVVTPTPTYLITGTEFRPISGKKLLVDLGSSSYPWRSIYAGTLTIGGADQTNASQTISSSTTLRLATTGSASIIFYTNNTQRARIDLDGYFRPETTNTYDLGTSSYRWRKLYIGTKDSYGGADTSPIYWNAGVPTAISNISLVATDTTSKSIEAGNSNGKVKLYAATNRGMYDSTNSKWIVHTTTNGANTYITNWKSKGSTSQPVYFNTDGEPAAISYTIAKSVPSDAKFTDTTYTFETGTTKGAFSVTPLGGSAQSVSIYNVVTYTKNTGISVAGSSKDTYRYDQTALFAPNGLIMGGTALSAGLVTRGICGVSTPDNTTGAASKDNLYINYDGDTTYRSNRQLVLQAGAVGTHYGNNVYQYAAVRGDAMKAWVEAKGYITSYINYYHTPSYSTGLLVATGTGVNDLYIPYATSSTTGAMRIAAGANVTNIAYENGIATIDVQDTTYDNKIATVDGTDISLVTTGEKYIWNNKQDALTSQTIYTAKGTSTKVAQITTNALGQVTNIAEVNIDFPTYSLNEIGGTDDLQAIEALTGTNGLLKKTATNTWTLDTNTYVTTNTNQIVTGTKTFGTSTTTGNITIANGTLTLDGVEGSLNNTKTVINFANGANVYGYIKANTSGVVFSSGKKNFGFYNYGFTSTNSNELDLGRAYDNYPTAGRWRNIYMNGSIIKYDGTNGTTGYTLTLPNKTGTIALISDLPTASSLGITSAMHFIGVSTNAITNGGNENTGISGHTKTAGDVVIYGKQEFVYGANNKWILLGDEGSYKIIQTAVADQTYSGTDTATTFVSSVTQNANGEITVTKRNLPVYNNYSHPTGDGNLHVPPTGTTNNGKFLKAGSTAGSLSWDTAVTSIILKAGTGISLDIDNTAITTTGTRTISLAYQLDGTYNASSNKLATESTVVNAIAAAEIQIERYI